MTTETSSATATIARVSREDRRKDARFSSSASRLSSARSSSGSESSEPAAAPDSAGPAWSPGEGDACVEASSSRSGGNDGGISPSGVPTSGLSFICGSSIPTLRFSCLLALSRAVLKAVGTARFLACHPTGTTPAHTPGSTRGCPISPSLPPAPGAAHMPLTAC